MHRAGRLAQRPRVLDRRRAAAACRRCRRAGGAGQRRKSRSAAEPLRERRDQLRRVLDVVELDHLDRRVHVAQRDRDDAGRDAAARDVERVGVGARVARGGADGERDALGLARLVQQLEDLRVERRAARDAPARSRTCGAPSSFSSMPGWSVAKVTSTTIAMSGLQRVRGRARAAEGDLLLRDRDAARRRRARRPPRPRAARPRARRSSRAGCPSSARRSGRSGTRPARRRSPRRRRSRTSGARLVAVGGADVDVQVLAARGTFLRSSSFSRWIGFLPTTPGTTPSRVAISTRWPTRMIGSQPPTPVNQRKPVVVDVVDDQPDLVDVPDDRERAGRRRCPCTRATVEPTRVVGDLGEGGGGLAEHGGGGLLVAGRAGRGEQLAEDVGDRHGGGHSSDLRPSPGWEDGARARPARPAGDRPSAALRPAPALGADRVRHPRAPARGDRRRGAAPAGRDPRPAGQRRVPLVPLSALRRLDLPAGAGERRRGRSRPAATSSSCRSAGARCATRSCCGVIARRPRAALRHPHHAGGPDLRLPRERGRAARAGLPRDRRPARTGSAGRRRASTGSSPRSGGCSRSTTATLERVGVLVALFAIVEGVEAVGLWLREALGGVPDVHRHDGAAPARALRDHPPLHPAQGPHADHQPRGLRVPDLREAAVRRARRRRRRGGAARARRGLARRRAGHPGLSLSSSGAGAARTAGSRRAGSTGPPWGCRSARAR